MTDTADAIEWLNRELGFATAELAKCEQEVAAFTGTPIGDMGFTESWETARHRAELRLKRWQTLADIVNDRDEWRTQHENLLSVRQSDLATRIESSPIPQGLPEWRCVNCKTVVAGHLKPDRCPECNWCVTFAEVAPTPLPRGSGASDEMWLDLAAAFGPTLKEAFPDHTAMERMHVADALADVVKAREGWFAADKIAWAEKVEADTARLLDTSFTNGRHAGLEEARIAALPEPSDAKALVDALEKTLTPRRLPGCRNGPITEPRELAEHIAAALAQHRAATQ